MVDRLAEHARGLLRRVEPHAVLGGDEVEPPLRLALERERRRELLGGRAPRLRRGDGVEQADQRLAAALESDSPVIASSDGIGVDHRGRRRQTQREIGQAASISLHCAACGTGPSQSSSSR